MKKLFLFVCTLALALGSIAGTHPSRAGLTPDSARLKEVLLLTPMQATAAAGLQQAASLNDFNGKWCAQYDLMRSNGTRVGFDGMCQFTFYDKDSVLISNFYNYGFDLKGKYDATTGKITIMPQFAFNEKPYGDFWFCLFDYQQGGFSSKSPVTLTLQSDGTLKSDYGWVLIIPDKNSTYYGVGIGMSEQVTFYKSNATMAGNKRNVELCTFSEAEYRVYVYQSSPDELTVANISNQGTEITFQVNSNKTMTAEPQMIFRNLYGVFCAMPASWSPQANKSVGVKTDIQVTGDENSISFGPWGVFNASGLLQCSMGFEYSAIMADDGLTFTYPAAGQTITFSGQGTAASPYIIANADDLAKLAKACNGGQSYTGKHFRQTADITLSSKTWRPIGLSETIPFAGLYDGNNHTISNLTLERGATENTGLFGYIAAGGGVQNLTVIGTGTVYSKYFGLVAGKNYGIAQNVHGRGQLTSYAEYMGGLFGLATKVDRCTFLGVMPTTQACTGGIAGEIYRDTISNCVVYANIDARQGNTISHAVGGIVGSLASSATTYTVVENNYFMGSMYDHTGYSHLGGIGGSGTSYCVYRGNVATGLMQSAVTSSTIGSCGSIVGSAYNCLVEQNYACCNLQGTAESSKVGGIVGLLTRFTADKTATMQNNVFTGQIIQKGALQPDYALYGRSDEGCKDINNYYDAQMAGTVPDLATSAKTTAYLTSGSALPGLDPSIWKFEKDYYPVPKYLPAEVAAFASTPVFLAGTQNASNVKTNFTVGQNPNVKWSVMNDGQMVQENSVMAISGPNVTLKGIVGKEFIAATTSITQGNFTRLMMLGIAPGQFPGGGTQDDPYIISTVQDFRTLNNAIVSSGQTFKGDYFKMANDIDFAGVTNFWGVSDQSNVAMCFEGTFDGAGHRIKNWKPNGIVKDQSGYLAQASSRSTIALFGIVGQSGCIKNVIIDASCDVRGANGIAGVVAINMGRIENCRNYAPITVALNQAGGICGRNTALGVISNCYNEGTITSGYYGPGGIVSTNDSATVENCQNAGIVQWAQVTKDRATTDASCAGGIAAVSTAKAVFRNCVNLGPVTFNTTVGGIVGGYAAKVTMEGCIGVGQVTATLGEKAEWGPIAGTIRSSVGFADNYFDAQVYTTGPAFGKDPDGVVWATTTQLTNGTPLAQIPAAIMDYTAGQYPSLKAFKDEAATAAYRKLVIYIAEGQTAADVTSDVTLSSQASWSIPQTTAFAIENGKLVLKNLPAPQSIVLTGTVGAYTRNFDIQAFKISLKGNGTEANPYQIATPEDFTQLYDLTSGCGIHFDGKYFAMVNDVDLASIENFRPIGFGGANSFNGVFDGRNHKVTNLKILTNNNKDSVNYGVFGTLGKNGIIRNFEVGSGSVKLYRYAATIVGINNGLVENCINRASVSTFFSYDCGGMVAQNSGTVKECKNYGTIETPASHVGGVVGFNNGGGLVLNCINYGTMVVSSYSGGVVGYGGGGVKGCSNYGTLTLGAYSGGVVGAMTSSTESVEDCTNYGQLTFTGGTCGGVVGNLNGRARNLVNKVDLDFTGGTYVGGLIGYSGSSSDIKGLKHDKRVTSTKNYVGGIIGTNNGVIDSCEFTGEVRSTAAGVGGIAGYCAGNAARVYHCTNYGKISSTTVNGFRVGGIVGYSSSGNIEDCFNLGDVTSEAYSVGGIVGEGYVKVYRCINNGNVKTTYDLATKKNGNVGGIIGHQGTEIRDCINYGAVTGLRYVGGLVGRPNTATKVCCNYVSAKITSSDPETTGMGVNLSADQTKVVADSNYYNTTVMPNAQQSEAAAARIKGISEFEMCQAKLGNSFDYHEYAMPTLKYFANNGDANLLATIVVFSNSDESFNNFRNSAYMMLLPGVTYQGSPYIIYEEPWSKLRANADTKGQSATITLTAPTLKRSYTFFLYNDRGVDAIDNGKQIASQRIFTLQGVELQQAPVGVPIVVVTTYTDGTTTSARTIYTELK